MTPSQSKIGSEEPIFASSPRGRAKSAYGAKQLDKLKFEVSAAGDRSKIIHILQSCRSCGKISANVPK
jgi:hypothetical protein